MQLRYVHGSGTHSVIMCVFTDIYLCICGYLLCIGVYCAYLLVNSCVLVRMQVIELPARSRCRLSTKNFQVRFDSGAESDKKGRWLVEMVLKAYRMRLRGIHRAPPSRFRPHRSPGALQLCHRHRTTMAHGGAQIRSESSHLNNFFQLVVNPFLIEDPEGNMVRSLHFEKDVDSVCLGVVVLNLS